MVPVPSILIAVALVSLEAPPYTILHPPELSDVARAAARSIPATVGRLSARLGSPGLPPSTLYLVPGRPAAGPGPPMPDWAAGIALPGSDTIVVRVDRLGQYGSRALTGVIAHETAHLLMAREAGAGDTLMPAWFREGVAANLARDGEMMDFFYLWISPVAASDKPLVTLAACFRSMDVPARRRAAYAGSYSFVRFLLGEHGQDLPRLVLRGLARGLDFEEAYRAAAGAPLADDERSWSSSIRGSRRWFAIVTSSFGLWSAITLIFLLAWQVRRLRSRRIMERWEEEEPFH